MVTAVLVIDPGGGGEGREGRGDSSLHQGSPAADFQRSLDSALRRLHLLSGPSSSPCPRPSLRGTGRFLPWGRPFLDFLLTFPCFPGPQSQCLRRCRRRHGPPAALPRAGVGAVGGRGAALPARRAGAAAAAAGRLLVPAQAGPRRAPRVRGAAHPGGRLLRHRPVQRPNVALRPHAAQRRALRRVRGPAGRGRGHPRGGVRRQRPGPVLRAPRLVDVPRLRPRRRVAAGRRPPQLAAPGPAAELGQEPARARRVPRHAGPRLRQDLRGHQREPGVPALPGCGRPRRRPLPGHGARAPRWHRAWPHPRHREHPLHGLHDQGGPGEDARGDPPHVPGQEGGPVPAAGGHVRLRRHGLPRGAGGLPLRQAGRGHLRRLLGGVVHAGPARGGHLRGPGEDPLRRADGTQEAQGPPGRRGASLVVLTLSSNSGGTRVPPQGPGLLLTLVWAGGR